MKYEIKEISLTSVLKVSFLVSTSILSISFIFIMLLVGRMVKFFGETMGNTSNLDILTELNLPAIIFGAIFNGILFSFLLLIVISLSIIFYNFFAKYVGGIQLDLSENFDNKSLDKVNKKIKEEHNE